MSKIGNIIQKAGKTMMHVAAGSLIYGVGVYSLNIHFDNPMIQLVWSGTVIPVLSGLIAGGMRWAQYDPSKAGK